MFWLRAGTYMWLDKTNPWNTNLLWSNYVNVTDDPVALIRLFADMLQV